MASDLDSDHTRAGLALRAASNVVVFTGAGVSAESGVPTFRDKLTGFWSRYDPRQLDTPAAYQDNPALVWGWYERRRALVSTSSPNPGHRAIATIEHRAPAFALITQNIDNLHERAGSTAPIHLHGSLFAPRCANCHRPADVPPVAAVSDGPIEPPGCQYCDGRLRPGVVWFGEEMPAGELKRAVTEAASCDLLISVGTSGAVFPAAEIPIIAADQGASVIQVNPEPTPLDELATFNLRGTAAKILPALVATAWPSDDPVV
jgi:NAD-dependent deacetylase